MQQAGLTHGGFYRHFDSKDALVAEASAAAFKKIQTMLEERATRLGAKAALSSYVAVYLSAGHVETPEMGCPVAAYGADVSRECGLVRDAFSYGLEQTLTWITEGLFCPQNIRRARAAELFSLMVGAVVAARSASEPKLAKEILTAARHRAGKLIEEKR